MKNFKNYSHLVVEWSAHLNGISGENGAGKTNILDAIYYLCTTKGYFNSTEQYNYRHETDYMILEGAAEQGNGSYEIQLKVAKGRKKELLLNKAKEDKLIDYVGRFPVVMIAPNDNLLILGPSEERRRLIDNGLCQSDRAYTDALIHYNKLIANRNALLKQLSEEPNPNFSVLETIDEMLLPYAALIFEERKKFAVLLEEKVSEIYAYISGEKEQAGIIYSSHLFENDFKTLLAQQRRKDLLLQRSTRGLHLDDLELTINGHPLKKIGSQGQQKTFVVALKMALYALLQNRKNLYPVLLLDDIFEKFDEGRVSRLFDWLGDGHKGQIFVSDTDATRMETFMKKSGRPFQLYEVKNNYVEKIR